MTYPATELTTPHRYPDRMHRDAGTVHGILDEALYCHLAFVGADGRPRVLPTLHVRIGGTLYVHGSTGSGPMLDARGGGLPVSVDHLAFSPAPPITWPGGATRRNRFWLRRRQHLDERHPRRQ